MKKTQEIIRSYKTLGFYKDKGDQVSTIISKAEDLTIKNKLTFETQFDRKGEFNFKYLRYNEQNEVELRGGIKYKGIWAATESIIEFAGGEPIQQEVSFNMAIASHTGISQKVSYIIPSLIYGNKLGGYLFYKNEENEEFECEIRDERCIGIKETRKIEEKIPENTDLQRFKAYFKGQVINIAQESTYYFRWKDLRLIRVVEKRESANLDFESTINYYPEFNC